MATSKSPAKKLEAFRIVHNRYVKNAFDGGGARKYGGRWNSKGTPVIYTAESLSLATLEILVHLEDASVLNENFSYIKIEFPEMIVEIPDNSLFPKDWYKNPPNISTQIVGDQWVNEDISAVLRVPSSVVMQEYNYILNPAHKDFNKISIESPKKLIIDSRIVKNIQ